MTLASLVAQYGLPAVFVGCLFEGETVLVVAAAAAHLGYLSLPEVIGVAAAGGFAGDQIAFAAGRRAGPALLRRWPALARRVATARERLGQHDAWVILGMRFAIGMRLALPVALGTSGISPVRFAALNAVGALAWATLFGVVGYTFGAALVSGLKRFGHDVEIALAVVAVVGLAWVALRRRRSRPRSDRG
jgi:membrane protein DedA with SNARE-associated domain